MRKLSTREQMAYRTIATLELERDALQQRLTVAERREANLLGTLVGVYQSCLLAGTKETLALAQCIESATEKDALKPAAEGEGS